jgi:hypothetical protein
MAVTLGEVGGRLARFRTRDGSPFYEIADLTAGATRFENTGIRNPSAIRYRIRNYNTGGYSAYSGIVA